MSVVTSGLKRKQEEITAHNIPKICTDCNGSGETVHGNVQTAEKGLMGLFDDCGNCSGSGRISVPVRKIKRRSKVEVIC